MVTHVRNKGLIKKSYKSAREEKILNRKRKSIKLKQKI